jgi:cytochrome c oxidase subunit 4
MDEPIVSVRTNVIVLLVLLGLAGLTTGVAYLDLGVFNTVVAMAIAVAKMTLVALFFMHVKYQPGLSRIAIVAGFFWLALLVSFTLADVFTRQWIPAPMGWGTRLTP